MNYTYDSLKRLSTVGTSGAGWGQSYSYGGFGNMTAATVTKGSGVNFAQAYDPSTNHAVGNVQFAYDANGNETWPSASYDGENRMTTPDGYKTYTYDPSGKRVYESTSGTLYFYDIFGKQVSTGGNVYFGNRLVVSAGAGVVVTDRLGSVRYSGGQALSYLPYGIEQTSTPNGQVKFGTYLRDGNGSTLGADYADQRYYNPWFGRFNTADPMKGGNAADPSGWNKYAYTRGDPVNRVDWSGLCDDSADTAYSVTVCGESESDPDFDIPSQNQVGVAGPAPGMTPFTRDRAYLIHAGGILSTRQSISAKCEGGLNALGVDFDALATAASLVDIQNGTTNNSSLASAYGDPQLGAAAQAQYDQQYAGYLNAHGEQHLTIAGYFAATGNTSAWTPMGGNTVYINPSLLNATASLNYDQGLMLHEMLHEVYGLDDQAVMRTLAAYDPGAGINPRGPSAQTTTWMVRNCIAGRGNN